MKSTQASAEAAIPNAIMKPARDPGETEEFPTAMAARIASRFALPAPVEACDFPGKGNINHHTFLILSGRPGQVREYLLQRINQLVFTRPETVMRAMIECLEAQRRSLARGALPSSREWEVIALVPTREGAPYLESQNRRGTTFWRLMVKIPDSRTYYSLSEVGSRREQLLMAEEAGRGLAIYGDFTSDMNVTGLVSPLPGYRDTKLYYAQLASVLKESQTLDEAAPFLPVDETVRQSTREHFLLHVSEREHRRRREDPEIARWIDLALKAAPYGLTLQREMAAGRIRTVAIHGDTKLENFLFSNITGKVKGLVDLDTIMPHTWLSDWGDMIRSLANVAGEKERDLSKVRVDMEIYEAVARGFLETARQVTRTEIALMADAVQIIALELGVRFLTDYLRGDSYFRLSPADPPYLNKTRALVQLTLFERLRENSGAARKIIEALASQQCAS